MNSIKNNNTKTRQVINFDEKVIKEALKDFSKSPCPVAAFNKFLCSLPSSTPFLSAWNKFSSCVIGDPELDFKEFLELNLDFEWKSLQIPGFHKQIFTGKCLNRGAPCFLVAVSEEDHLQIEACIHDYETDESPCEWHNQFAIAVTEGKYISLYDLIHMTKTRLRLFCQDLSMLSHLGWHTESLYPNARMTNVKLL
jgi:hypothetical protein